MTRRALCVGTNYAGTANQLAGCVNDAEHWREVLAGRGYETVILADHDATRQGMLDGFSGLVGEAGYGDRVVLTYSGHGTWVPDRDGDEPDRRDEAICPDDFAHAGLITDDDLYEVFSSAARGVRVLFVADSCFSGTLQRFAGPVEQVSGERERISHRTVRFLPPSAFLGDDDLAAARTAERAAPRGRFRRSALVMSACADTQVTYDAFIDGVRQGLFTHVALTALAGLPAGASYRDWHRAIRTRLPSVDYPDVTPQLDGTSTQKRWDVLA